LSAPLPALPRIQALGIPAGRIEHQQRLAGAESATLGGSEQRGPDATPTRSPVHEHLREVPTMRLILRLSQDHLNGAHDRSRRVFGGEHHSLAARHTRGRAAPERFRLGPGHREHEADGGAALHTVDQHLAQSLDLAITDGLQISNLNGVRHVISSTHANVPWR